MTILYENLILGEDEVTASHSTVWMAQTFTPSVSHEIGSVKLLLDKTAGSTPGTFTVSVKATSGGFPTGSDLCVGTTNGNTLIDYPGKEWREITFTSPTSLTSSTKYALVWRALTGDVSNAVGAWYDFDNGYAGGDVCYSNDSGSTWAYSPFENSDFLFEDRGIAFTPKIFYY